MSHSVDCPPAAALPQASGCFPVADAKIELDIDQRIITWITVLLDPEAPVELKATAWRMIYLTGYLESRGRSAAVSGFKVPVSPPKPDGAGGIQSSRIAHAYTGEAITPSEARDLANGLLSAADAAERLDAVALPHLREFIAVVEDFAT